MLCLPRSLGEDAFFCTALFCCASCSLSCLDGITRPLLTSSRAVSHLSVQCAAFGFVFCISYFRLGSTSTAHRCLHGLCLGILTNVAPYSGVVSCAAPDTQGNSVRPRARSARDVCVGKRTWMQQVFTIASLSTVFWLDYEQYQKFGNGRSTRMPSYAAFRQTQPQIATSVRDGGRHASTLSDHIDGAIRGDPSSCISSHH